MIVLYQLQQINSVSRKQTQFDSKIVISYNSKLSKIVNRWESAVASYNLLIKDASTSHRLLTHTERYQKIEISIMSEIYSYVSYECELMLESSEIVTEFIKKLYSSLIQLLDDLFSFYSLMINTMDTKSSLSNNRNDNDNSNQFVGIDEIKLHLSRITTDQASLRLSFGFIILLENIMTSTSNRTINEQDRAQHLKLFLPIISVRDCIQMESFDKFGEFELPRLSDEVLLEEVSDIWEKSAVSYLSLEHYSKSGDLYNLIGQLWSKYLDVQPFRN
jgi:hypothetical protein